MGTSSPINIFAVKEVQKTSKILCSLFSWKSAHGGNEFDILVDEKGHPSLLLHDFNAHGHARFKNLNRKIGVGQSMYVFVSNFEDVYKKVKRKKLEIVEPLFFNENSEASEFTFKLDEGYQISVCDTDEWLFY